MMDSISIDGDDVPLLDVSRGAEDQAGTVNPSEWAATSDRCLIYSDLDLFFSDVYLYYRHKGFTPILLSSVLSIAYILIVSSVTVFSLHCIDANSTRLFAPAPQCLKRIGPTSWFVYFLCLLFASWKSTETLKTLYRLRDIHWLYEHEMGISENEIQYFGWPDVQQRLILAQERLKFCMLKPSIDELDIHQRLLRYTNYELALFSQAIIRPVFKVPFIGEIAYYPSLLSAYVRQVIFRGSDGLFLEANVLNPAIKTVEGRQRLARRLQHRLTMTALGGLVFSPLFLLFKLLDNFYKHAEAVRQNPSVFSKRVWTQYGRIVLRHFNELDHELEQRLDEAYPIANSYLDAFVNYTHCAFFRFTACICGSLAALIVLQTTVYSQLFFKQGLLASLTVLGMLYKICIGLLPTGDDQFKQVKESMKELTRHFHYVEHDWLVWPSRPSVRNDVTNLLAHRIEHIIHEVSSPIFTPFILLFHLRPRAEQIVNFFNDYTVSIQGLGDVCSLTTLGTGNMTVNESNKAEGTIIKTKLSMMRFHLANPQYQLPEASVSIVNAIKAKLQNELTRSDMSDKQILQESCMILHQQLVRKETTLSLP